jgi:mRNA-degrading endonuclease RelE of RelBE toxin-antitoxin system
MEVRYSHFVEKTIKKGKLPKEIWFNFRDAFSSLALTSNFRLFDIKKMINHNKHLYYRMRIGSYRALFWLGKDIIFVEKILPRGEVYK